MSQAPGIPGAVLAEHLERPGPMRGRAFSGALWVSPDRQGYALAPGPRQAESSAPTRSPISASLRQSQSSFPAVRPGEREILQGHGVNPYSRSSPGLCSLPADGL